MTLLILEDDTRVAVGILRVLSMMGHSAKHAKTIAEGEALLAEQPYDFVIADIGLARGESGSDFLSIVKARCPSARRVLTTGAQVSSDEMARADHEFLPKPFGASELARLIDRK